MIVSAQNDAPPPRRSVDLFDLDDYHSWIRQAVILGSDPSLTPLFDSTIDEPVAELGEVVRNAFWPRPSDRYVSVFAGGNPFMIDALAKRYGRPREAFMATTGATAGLNLVLSSLVGLGDHVLVEAPGFYLLEKLARAAGATVSKLPRRAPSFDIDLGELSGLLGPDTKAVVITNLHNPTGARLSHEQLTAVAQTAAGVGAVLIVDEVYGDFAREVSKRSAADAGDNVLAVSSLTKVFGLYTLKAGWITATPALLAKISADNIEVGYEIGKLSHMVAALVLEAFEPFEAHWKRVLSANQAIVNRHAARLTAAGLIEGAPPEYGCIYFPKIVGCEDSRPVARLLWREQKLLVAPGEYFNLPGHIRIGYGSADPAAIEDGMSRLSAGLARRAGKAYP